MRIGILGTGHVAGLLATAWQKAGHDVTLGSRDPKSKQLDFAVDTLNGAADVAQVIVNAVVGAEAVETMAGMDQTVTRGKTVIDVTNAVTPEFLPVYPNSSVAQELQTILPEARVVKTMNTAAMTLMVNPKSIGPSSVFVSGNDADAKMQVRDLLGDLGWSPDSVVDLGGVETASAAEKYFYLFAGLAGVLQTEQFNIRVVRA